MKKNKIEIIITGVLVIILIVAISNIFRKREEKIAKTETSKAITARAKGPVVSTKQAKAIFKDLEDRAGQIGWDRDPFVYRSRDTIGVVGDLKLDGIVWDRHSPKAMINGIIVGIGEQVGEHTILDITKDSVILTDGVIRIEIKL